MRKTFLLCAAFLATAFSFQAKSALIVDVFDDGNDLVFSWSGSFDTSSATGFDTGRSGFGPWFNTGSFFRIAGQQPGTPLIDWGLNFTARPDISAISNASVFLQNGQIFGDGLFFESTLAGSSSVNQIWLPGSYV